MPLSRCRYLLVLTSILTIVPSLNAQGPDEANQDLQNWSQFRGPAQDNQADVSMPGTLGNDDIAWQVDLPGRGVSGPVVANGRVFVTCSSTSQQNELHVMCFDTASGSQLWHRQFWALGRCGSDPTSANAAPTPVTDGKHLIAFYSSNDLVCFDMDGNLKWLRALTDDYPKAANDIGMASSPLIYNDRVIVQVENQGDSFVAAIRISDGTNLWKVPRPRKASWSSPALIPAQQGNAAQVVVLSQDRLSALNIDTGATLWDVPGSAYPIPSPVFHAPTNSLLASLDGLTCFRIQGTDPPEKVWSEQRLSPSNVSIALQDDQLYTLNRGSVAVCADLATGEESWKARVGGNHYSSPIVVGKHIYYFAQDGTARVIDQSLVDPEVVAERPFDEPILGSPAADQTGLYVRLQNRLIKLSAR